jgi:uncharacterized protein (TIGR02594 family)
MRGVFAAIACLCLLSSVPAEARSGPDCINVMTVSGLECVSPSTTASVRHAKASKGVARVARVTQVAGKVFKTAPVVSFHSSGAAWLAQAKVYTGKRGADLRVKHRRLWCGEFVCKVMAEVGKECPPGYAKATSWARVGRRLSSPQVGAIAVYRHHVGIVAGVNGDGSIILLSGNYNDRVHEGPYRSRGLIGYYWPEA